MAAAFNTLPYPERFYAAVSFAAKCVRRAPATLSWPRALRQRDVLPSLTPVCPQRCGRSPPEDAKSVEDETRLLLYALFQQVRRPR